MNRRSVLRWLGLAPVAAPAAVAAASGPALPPIDYTALAEDVSKRTRVLIEESGFGIEGLPDGGSRVVCFSTAEHARAWARETSETAAIVKEMTARSVPDDRPIFLPISALPRLG